MPQSSPWSSIRPICHSASSISCLPSSGRSLADWAFCTAASLLTLRHPPPHLPVWSSQHVAHVLYPQVGHALWSLHFQHSELRQSWHMGFMAAYAMSSAVWHLGHTLSPSLPPLSLSHMRCACTTSAAALLSLAETAAGFHLHCASCGPAHLPHDLWLHRVQKWNSSHNMH